MCVVIYAIIDNKKILVKNRDRYYTPKMEIVHEIINGTEVVYTRDEKSNCLDGMNEYGIGYINSKLSTKHYKKNDSTKDYLDKEMYFIQNESPKIKLDIISQNNLQQSLDLLLDNKYFEDLSLQGHILIASPKQCFHIETTTQDNPVVKPIYKNIVLTNHGISYPEAGNNQEKSYKSSLMRKMIMEKRLKNVNNLDELLIIMRKRCYDIDPFFCPYKDRTLMINNNKPIENTTNQVLYNLTDRVVVFNYDINSSTFLGIKNNLPKNYKPKIKIEINKIGTIFPINISTNNLLIISFILILIILIFYYVKL